MTSARTTTLAMCTLLAFTAGGCIVDADGDDDGFDLSVDLYWDRDFSEEFFEGTTCRDASVDNMDYELVDRRGNVWRRGTEVRCANFLDFVNLPFGTFSLFIWGFDRQGEQLWSTECRGLELPFGGIYECEIDSPGLL